MEQNRTSHKNIEMSGRVSKNFLFLTPTFSQTQMMENFDEGFLGDRRTPTYQIQILNKVYPDLSPREYSPNSMFNTIFQCTNLILPLVKEIWAFVTRQGWWENWEISISKRYPEDKKQILLLIALQQRCETYFPCIGKNLDYVPMQIGVFSEGNTRRNA